jgi:hypothetical protein
VLDLKNTAPGYVGGLLLPYVTLAGLETVPASWVGSGTLDASKLKGLMVYNTNAVLGTGIYVWDGAKWQAIITA